MQNTLVTYLFYHTAFIAFYLRYSQRRFLIRLPLKLRVKTLIEELKVFEVRLNGCLYFELVIENSG